MVTRSAEIPLSELVVLGLLAECPRHGYDIEQQIVKRRFREWTPLGKSLIYHVLGRVRKRGWVASKQKESLRGPGADQCSLTAEGKKNLRNSVEASLAHNLHQPARVQLALIFGWVLGHEQLVAALKTRMQGIAAELLRSKKAQSKTGWPNAAKKNKENEKTEAFTHQIRGLVFGHFDSQLRADLAWCKKATVSLRPD